MNLKIEGAVRNHFNQPNSMANLILNQINNGIYTEFDSHMRDGVVLDLGANIGLFSAYASALAKKVYSVEPTRSHQDVFETLVKDNEFKNVTLIKGAIAPESGEMDFYESRGNSTMNSLFDYGPGSDKCSYKVQAYSLEDLLDKTGESTIDFIKMDIEGSEKYLYNSPNFFRQLIIVKAIFIEIHEVDGKSFAQLTEEWKEKLRMYFPIVESRGVDGIFASVK